MKKTYIAICIIVLSIVLIYVFVPKSDGDIRIGAVLSLSGSTSSFYGEYNKNAIDLLVREVNQSGGISGKKITVVYEDSEGDKVKGIQAFNKLVHQGISYVISDISPVSVGVAPLASSTKTILIATSASNPILSTMGEYVFRTKLAAQHEGVLAAKYIREHIKPKSIAFIYQNSDYGTGVFGAFKKELGSGVKIVVEEKYEKDSLDMRTQITNIHSASPDLVIVAGFPKEVGQILKQSGEMKTGLKFFAHSGSIGPDIEKIAGQYASGLMYLTELDTNTLEHKIFAGKYSLLYGVDPELFASNAYDALGLLVEGLRACGDEKMCIREYISKISGYKGVSGNITFDSNGDIVQRVLICKTLVLEGVRVVRKQCEVSVSY